MKEKERQNNPETAGGDHRGCRWKESGAQVKKIYCFAKKTVMMAGFLLLLGSYLFLNLARYTAQMDSDIAAEGLNARAIWEYHTLIPSQFYSSTETRILNVNLIGALFYGLTGDMNLSMGIACSIMMILLLTCFWKLLQYLGCRKECRAAASVLLLALPGSLRHAQILYLWASYYAVHCILMLITLRSWLAAIHGERGWKKEAAFSCVLAFIISLSGLRAALICYVPLAVTEILRWIAEALSRMEKRSVPGKIPASGKGEKSLLRSGGCAAGFLILAYLGSLFPTSVGVPVSRNMRNGPEKLRSIVLLDLWNCLEDGQDEGNRRIFLSVFILLTVAAVGCCFVRIIQRIFGERKQKKAAEWRKKAVFPNGKNAGIGLGKEESPKERDQERILLFAAISLLTSVLMGAFTTTESVWRYYFMIWFLLSFGVAFVMDHMREKLRGIGLLAVLLFGLLVWKQEMFPVLQASPVHTEWQEITDWMQENGYYYGYSTYDTANAMTGACNGTVQISAVSGLDTLEICKWLTDRTWYVPYVSENTKTVYVIPKSREEEFRPQVLQHADIELQFETENYSIYSSPHNYTSS